MDLPEGGAYVHRRHSFYRHRGDLLEMEMLRVDEVCLEVFIC